MCTQMKCLEFMDFLKNLKHEMYNPSFFVEKL